MYVTYRHMLYTLMNCPLGINKVILILLMGSLLIQSFNLFSCYGSAGLKVYIQTSS